MNSTDIRVGYAPYTPSLSTPGDRRRFVAYARARELPFEIADPSKRYDVVVVTETADVTVWCDYPHGRVVFDFIDSYLAIPPSNVRQWLRGPAFYALGRHRKFRLNYWEVLRRMCSRADGVVCTTEEQRNDIQAFCANVHIILDVHEPEVRSVKTNYDAHQPFRLLWEGLPSNLPQLRRIGRVLERTNRRHPIELNVVTDARYPRLSGLAGQASSIREARRVFSRTRFHPWSESGLALVAGECDLGVIPIDLDDPFVAGKPENKLLLMWRLGLPVLASATPAYLRAMAAAGTPELSCASESEWYEALTRAIDDVALRRDAGARGRTHAESHHSVAQLFGRWDALMASLGLRW